MAFPWFASPFHTCRQPGVGLLRVHHNLPAWIELLVKFLSSRSPGWHAARAPRHLRRISTLIAWKKELPSPLRISQLMTRYLNRNTVTSPLHLVQTVASLAATRHGRSAPSQSDNSQVYHPRQHMCTPGRTTLNALHPHVCAAEIRMYACLLGARTWGPSLGCPQLPRMPLRLESIG